MFSQNCYYPNQNGYYQNPYILNQQSISSCPTCQVNNSVPVLGSNTQNNNSLTARSYNSANSNDARQSSSPYNSYGQNILSLLNESYPSQPQASVIGPLPTNIRINRKKKYTSRQIQQLENVFVYYDYLTYCPQRHVETLVSHTGLQESQVKHWFHNRRYRVVKEKITQSTDEKPIKEALQTVRATREPPVLSSLGCICCAIGVDTEEITRPVQYTPRMNPSPWQIKILELGFSKTRYVANQAKKNELNALVKATGLPDFQIISWFQRRRERAKRHEQKMALERFKQKNCSDDGVWNVEIEKRLENICKTRAWLNERERTKLAKEMGISTDRLQMWLIQFRDKQVEEKKLENDRATQMLTTSSEPSSKATIQPTSNQLNNDETSSSSSKTSLEHDVATNSQNQCQDFFDQTFFDEVIQDLITLSDFEQMEFSDLKL